MPGALADFRVLMAVNISSLVMGASKSTLSLAGTIVFPPDMTESLEG